MKITLNGSIFAGEEEFYLEDFEIEIDSGLDILDLFIDDTCEGCDLDEDEFLDPLEELIEEYVEVLAGECMCPDCVRAAFENFTYELIHGE